MGAMASQITSLTIVYSTVYTGADQRKHQSSASLAYVWGIPAQMVSNAENVFIWWRHHDQVIVRKSHGKPCRHSLCVAASTPWLRTAAFILTLVVLKSLWETLNHINIFLLFLTLRWYRLLKSVPMEDMNPFYIHPDHVSVTDFVIHYSDVIISAMTSQITSLMIVYSEVDSGADERKHQSSASLAFVWGIHRWRWIPRTRASNA